MNNDSKILVVGHNDLLENALVSQMKEKGYKHVDSSSTLGLNTTIQASVYEYFQEVLNTRRTGILKRKSLLKVKLHLSSYCV